MNMNTQPPAWAMEAAREIQKSLGGLGVTGHFAAIISKHFPPQPVPVSGECEFCEPDGAGNHAGYKAAESRISELEAALNTEKENVTILRAQRNTLTEAAEAKSGDVAKLRAVLEEVVRTDDAALQEIKKLGVEPGAESLRITNLCRAALASVPAETGGIPISFTFCPRCGDQMNPKNDASAPKVDATLESIAQKLRTIRCDPQYYRATEQQLDNLADALSAHAIAESAAPGENEQVKGFANAIRSIISEQPCDNGGRGGCSTISRLEDLMTVHAARKTEGAK